MQCAVFGSKDLPCVLMSSVSAVSEKLHPPEQLKSAIHLSASLTLCLMMDGKERKLSGGKMRCLPMRMVAGTLALTAA